MIKHKCLKCGNATTKPFTLCQSCADTYYPQRRLGDYESIKPKTKQLYEV